MDWKDLIKSEYDRRFPKGNFFPGVSFVPVAGKVFDEREIFLAIEAVLDGHWTEGRFAKAFEDSLAGFLGVKFCSLVNSGSSANLLALTALTSSRISEEKRLKRGDEIITVAAGFPTTVNPIVFNGLVPVFVDVEIGSYNASLESIKEAVTKKTKAVFIAHTLGNPFEVEELADFCNKNNLWLIEDNCDALGSKYNGKFTGTFGHISTFSFYPAHHVTMGEGGAVFTRDPLLSKIIRSLRDWGRDCSCPTGGDNFCGNRFGRKFGDLPQGYDHKYTYCEIGYNLKITDIQAAIGLAQMEKLPDFIRKRRENFDYLYKAFKEMDDFFILPSWTGKSEPSWFGFPLAIRESSGFTRQELLEFLDKRRIGVRLLFAGNVVRQPYFKNYNIQHRISEGLQNSDKIMNDMFWIGVYPGLNREMLDYVIGSFGEFLKNR